MESMPQIKSKVGSQERKRPRRVCCYATRQGKRVSLPYIPVAVRYALDKVVFGDVTVVEHANQTGRMQIVAPCVACTRLDPFSLPPPLRLSDSNPDISFSASTSISTFPFFHFPLYFYFFFSLCLDPRKKEFPMGKLLFHPRFSNRTREFLLAKNEVGFFIFFFPPPPSSPTRQRTRRSSQLAERTWVVVNNQRVLLIEGKTRAYNAPFYRSVRTRVLLIAKNRSNGRAFLHDFERTECNPLIPAIRLVTREPLLSLALCKQQRVHSTDRKIDPTYSRQTMLFSSLVVLLRVRTLITL